MQIPTLVFWIRYVIILQPTVCDEIGRCRRSWCTMHMWNLEKPHLYWPVLENPCSHRQPIHDWVGRNLQSGLRDDVAIQKLQDACLKLVVAARARAQKLQVDMQVEKANTRGQTGICTVTEMRETSLLGEGRPNRLPVHCRRLGSLRRRIVIPVATQASLCLVCLPFG